MKAYKLVKRAILEWKFGLFENNKYTIECLTGVISLIYLHVDKNCNILKDDVYNIFSILILEGERSCCELMINSGIYNVEMKRPYDRSFTHLSFAAYIRNLQMCNFLIVSGCRLNSRCKNKDTALIIASEKGYIDICKLLINSGCNLNAIGHEGHTALTKAAINKNFKICELLINSGCRTDIGCKSGREELMSDVSAKFRINQPK